MSYARREGSRVKFFEKYLLNHNGKNFECFLEDFSSSGILVKCDELSAESLSLGDICTVILSDAPKTSPSEIRCRVARHTANQIGLEFSF